MRPRTDRQTQRRAWPQYISRGLRLTRNVIKFKRNNRVHLVVWKKVHNLNRSCINKLKFKRTTRYSHAYVLHVMYYMCSTSLTRCYVVCYSFCLSLPKASPRKWSYWKLVKNVYFWLITSHAVRVLLLLLLYRVSTITFVALRLGVGLNSPRAFY